MQSKTSHYHILLSVRRINSCKQTNKAVQICLSIAPPSLSRDGTIKMKERNKKKKQIKTTCVILLYLIVVALESHAFHSIPRYCRFTRSAFCTEPRPILCFKRNLQLGLDWIWILNLNPLTNSGWIWIWAQTLKP